jgi:hypothetical protein
VQEKRQAISQRRRQHSSGRLTYRHEHEDTLTLRNTGLHFCQISVNKGFSTLV